jgi:large subunit ribosomal protein L32
MPVPKRKRSRARRDSRFANKAMKPGSVIACAECSKPVRPHIACFNCGFYGGKKVLTTKNDRAVQRATERAAQQARSSEKQAPASE